MQAVSRAPFPAEVQIVQRTSFHADELMVKIIGALKPTHVLQTRSITLRPLELPEIRLGLLGSRDWRTLMHDVRARLWVHHHSNIIVAEAFSLVRQQP